MNEYPITNIRALYADKATEGGELDAAINAAATEEELQALADVVANKVVFDGEFKIMYTSSTHQYVLTKSVALALWNTYMPHVGSEQFLYKTTGYFGFAIISVTNKIIVTVYLLDENGNNRLGKLHLTINSEPSQALTFTNSYVEMLPNDMDSTPTENSTKPVTSGGVYSFVKPIYWHSCTLKRITEGALVFYIDFIIMNNDPAPFTLTSFLDWLMSFEDIEIKAVQGYTRDHSSNLVSYFTKGGGTSTIYLHSIDLSTGEDVYDHLGVTANYGVTLTDNGVNRIN